MSDLTPNDSAGPAPLALRPREAARALGIGTRLLWELTNMGKVPHVKVGRCILYPLDQLREWLAREAEKAVQR
jgi:excisionase family DNA binding protein